MSIRIGMNLAADTGGGSSGALIPRSVLEVAFPDCDVTELTSNSVVLTPRDTTLRVGEIHIAQQGNDRTLTLFSQNSNTPLSGPHFVTQGPHAVSQKGASLQFLVPGTHMKDTHTTINLQTAQITDTRSVGGGLHAPPAIEIIL